MKKLYAFIMSLACLLTFGTSAWAQDRVTLIDIDFSTWEDMTICNGSTYQETVNGLTFYSKNSSKQFSIASGVMTWPNNNYSSNNYFIGIPLENINGNIYLSAWNGTSNTRITYCWKGGATEFTTNPGSGTSSKSAAPTTATIADATNTSGWLYVGRQGSGTTQCTRILIETDAPAKSEVSRETSVTGVTINGEAISAGNLATLLADKSLTLTEYYIAAPAVVFATNTHIEYDDASTDDVAGTVNATVEEVSGKFVATATVNEVDYTITVNKNVEAALEVSPAAVTLTSEKMGTAIVSITVTGANLTGEAIAITLPAVAGLTCSAESLPITDGSVSGTITLSYKSTEDVAEALANITLSDGTTSATIAVTYSSTAALTTIESISGAATWNWNGANSTQIQLTDATGKGTDVVLANWDGWAEGFNAAALMVNGEYLNRTNVNPHCFQGSSIRFNTTVPGVVKVSFSNTGSKNGTRTLLVNGTETKGSSSTSSATTDDVAVAAGDVVISGLQTAEGGSTAVGDAAQLRIYSITFTPTESIAFADGSLYSYSPSFDVTIPENANVYAITSGDATSGALTLVSVEGKLKAGEGVFLCGTAGETAVFAATTSGAEIEGNIIKSVTADGGEEFAAGTIYILGADNKLHPNNAGTLAKGKAYIPVGDVTRNGAAAPIRLIFGDDEATGIDAIQNSDLRTQNCFNLAGQKVTEDYKGIVVMNGKKVLVK